VVCRTKGCVSPSGNFKLEVTYTKSSLKLQYKHNKVRPYPYCEGGKQKTADSSLFTHSTYHRDWIIFSPKLTASFRYANQRRITVFIVGFGWDYKKMPT